MTNRVARFVLIAVASLFVAIMAPCASAEPRNLAQMYAQYKRAGMGNVVSGERVRKAGITVFAYRIDYFRGGKKSIVVCTGEPIAIGAPVLVFIDKKFSHPACSEESFYLPVESLQAFVMPGIRNLYDQKAMIRANLPQSGIIGCDLRLLAVGVQVREKGRVVERSGIGPFFVTGEYFYVDEFAECVDAIGGRSP
jgi:hypothetical protein